MIINNTQNSPEFKGFFTVLVDTSQKNSTELAGVVSRRIRRDCFARSIPYHEGLQTCPNGITRTPVTVGKADYKTLCETKENLRSTLFVGKPAFDAKALLEAMQEGRFDFEKGIIILGEPLKVSRFARAKGLFYDAYQRFFGGHHHDHN